MIREGRIEDLPQVLALIKELAVYEKAGEEVENTVEQMERDGFGPNPAYGLFVAESEKGDIVGIAIYYYRYSTWKGRRIYLEDIVVTESERGNGLGKKLFDTVIAKGKEEKCTGMVWQVLDWNEPAINFYKKYYDADLDSEWINCSINF
ncbi:GNAT family N-acetyltransferase [Fulvivirga sediminis]|uniref:GNAT family N-acetyltransferase n=1 Tax=Fulvivirga sediminis TaxID=2803949 RepID=A0A937JZ19_9BACT|nr:GNAT family N-acetyltransferase [Fulvivirga sediminis]MBL3656978.1 GNAT family N-acetyltransferase [Fulvivirga sediminis]